MFITLTELRYIVAVAIKEFIKPIRTREIALVTRKSFNRMSIVNQLAEIIQTIHH